MKSIKCKDFNIILFSSLFEDINVKFLDNLYDNQSISVASYVSFSDKLTKRIFYHTLIYEMCEKYVHIKKNIINPIIFFDEITELPDNYDDLSILNKEIYKILKTIQKKLPILIFFPKNPIDNQNLCDKYFWDEGEGQDIIYLVEYEYEKFNMRSYNFKKIKNFTKNKGLKFLSEDYFNKIKTKTMLYFA